MGNAVGIYPTGDLSTPEESCCNQQERSVILGKACSLLKVSSSFQVIVAYFEPIYQHYLLTLPLSKAYRQQTALVPELWNALLQQPPFNLDPMFLHKNIHEKQHLAQLCYRVHGTYVPGSELPITRKQIMVKQTDINDQLQRLNRASYSLSMPSFSIMRSFDRMFLARQGGGASSQHPQDNNTSFGTNRFKNMSRGSEEFDSANWWKFKVRRLHLALSRVDFRLNQSTSITVDNIVTILATVGCCPEVQLVAVKKLGELMETERLRVQARLSEIPDLLFAIISDNHGNETLLSVCLHTIMLLLRPLGGSQDTLYNQQEMTTIKLDSVCDYGIKIVLDTMRYHLNSAEIQHMGCWALVNLALESEHKKVLLQQDAIGVICDALVEHSSNEQVIFRALFGLINLVTEGYQPLAGSSKQTAEGLCKIVMSSLVGYIHDQEIACRGAMVLFNMSIRRSHHPILLHLNTIEILEDIMERHSQHRLLCHVSLRTINRLRDENGGVF